MTNRENMKKLYGEYHQEVQAQHNAAWACCEAYVLSLVKKGAKVFKAHHAVEHARDIYSQEFCKGLPADLYKKAVMRAYGKDAS